tara:strand:+ start:3058 stop:3405 length:348 start_codon:yes stop_codon:yes gene_type:complete
MKHIKILEEFLTEKKPNVKKNVKSINKKIGKQIKKAEGFAAKSKEDSQGPEVKDKMSASLNRMKMQLAQIEAQKQSVKKNIEIQKAQVRTAKKKDKANDKIEKKADDTKEVDNTK